MHLFLWISSRWQHPPAHHWPQTTSTGMEEFLCYVCNEENGWKTVSAVTLEAPMHPRNTLGVCGFDFSDHIFKILKPEKSVTHPVLFPCSFRSSGSFSMTCGGGSCSVYEPAFVCRGADPLSLVCSHRLVFWMFPSIPADRRWDDSYMHTPKSLLPLYRQKNSKSWKCQTTCYCCWCFRLQLIWEWHCFLKINQTEARRRIHWWFFWKKIFSFVSTFILRHPHLDCCHVVCCYGNLVLRDSRTLFHYMQSCLLWAQEKRMD